MEAAARCLNCAAPLAPAQRHCSDCGQAAATHRISVAHFAHELGHALLHADRNLLVLTSALARRPGVVVREYLSGRRKHYFNPFAYLLLVAALSTLALQGIATLSGAPREAAAIERPASVAARTANETVATADAGAKNAASPADTPQSVRQKQRARDAGAFLRKQQNLMMLLAVPFNALVFWLAFLRRRLYYAEHLTANVFLVAFLMLFTSLLFYPLMAWTRGNAAFAVVLDTMLLSHALYLAVAYVQWLDLRRWPQRLYALAVSAAAIAGWAALTTLALRWYITH